MADFLKAFIKTGAHEGGYANDRDDLGGETAYGIARRYHPDWSGWELVDFYKDDHRFPEILDLDDTLAFRVELFFKTNFWDVNRLDEVASQTLAEELYDTGVNLGVKKAAIFLQESLNLTNRNGKDYPDLTVDGVVGPVTLMRCNFHERIENVEKTINIMQGWHYVQICKARPSQEKFYNGWLNRVAL